ncbi:MAG: iron-sulfur cluster repair di-iron protein [Chitinophagales bacterium]|nr:iron-sulfur cluster repair di-iron protein [Chitinophagales bacterium]
MNIEKESKIGAIVAQDYRTAQVFNTFGIDFCCGGKRTISEACASIKVDADQVVEQLNALSESDAQEEANFVEMPLDELIHYIENQHHQYIRLKIPFLLQILEKIKHVHGHAHPELVEVYDLFKASSEDLLLHLHKEEAVLFPYVLHLVEANKNNVKIDTPPFLSIQNPVLMMEEDHELEGDRFKKIALLTNDFHLPEGACHSYAIAYQELHAYVKDLHKHIHLENNILFPKAVVLEQTCMQKA